LIPESLFRHRNLNHSSTLTYTLKSHSNLIANMAKKGGAAAGGGEGSKKAQGQARKADAAAAKNAAKERQAEAAEAEEWNKGAKSNSKACVYMTGFESMETDCTVAKLPPQRLQKPRARRPRRMPF
jgi:hypothetical protein